MEEQDRKDLKIQALVERMATLTAQHENEFADLRVDFTTVSQERDALAAEVKEIREQLEATKAHAEQAGDDVSQETDPS